MRNVNKSLSKILNQIGRRLIFIPAAFIRGEDHRRHGRRVLLIGLFLVGLGALLTVAILGIDNPAWLLILLLSAATLLVTQHYWERDWQGELRQRTAELAAIAAQYRQVEETLRQNEERYRIISAVTSDFTFTDRVESDGHQVTEWITAAAFRMTGLTHAEWSSLEAWERILYPADKFLFRASWERTLSGQPDAIEYRIVTGDGQLRWLRRWTLPVWDEATQRVTCIYGAAQDITQRKQAEEALREGEEKYWRLFELESDALFLIDNETGHILEVNAAAVNLYGYSREELLQKRNVDLSAEPTATRQATYAGLTRIPVRFHHNKNGAVFPVEITASHLLWQGRPAHIAAIRDITERMQIDTALWESAERFRRIIEGAEAGYFLIDREGKFQRVNAAWLRLHKYDSADEVIGQHFSLTQVDTDLEQAETIVAKLLNGEALPPGEFTRRCRDGTIGYHTFSISPVIHDDKVIGLEGFIIDTTARKQAEQQHLALLLERERIQILADFITQASHEFRTPLATINTSTYLLQKTTDPLTRQQQIQQIEERVQDIAALVDALTTMAKLDSTQSLTEEVIDLGGVVESVHTSRQKSLQAKHLHSQLDLPAQPVMARGDIHYLQQALGCILDNAIRFTPDEGAITIGVAQTATNSLIEIADTGVGIPANAFPRIFERFYRVDKSGTTRGFGLGLPIAQAIVDRHGGRIEATSEVGKGSVFRILLPPV